MSPPRRRWSEAEHALLRDLYPTTPTAELARMFGCSPAQLWRKANRLNLRKTPAYLAEHAGRIKPGSKANAQSFRPGHVAWNKGVPYDAGGNSARHRFSKGHRPQTWVPVGSETFDADGYLKRKVRDDAPRGYSRRNWRYVHALVWEEHHGQIPPGYAVTFRNGDKTDVRIENLELVSRKQMMLRSSVHNLPKPLAQLIQLKGALQRQINKRGGPREKRHRRSA